VGVRTSPNGIAFDGRYVWVVNGIDDNVIALSPKTGASRRTVSVGDGPIGICFDGASIWVANHLDNTVDKFTPSLE
jgi:YVTN family beta-propeller protein